MCYNSQRALLVFPTNISFSMAVLHRSILLLIIPLLFAPTQAASEGRRYAACSRSFTCSNLDPLDYPFWGGEARPSFCGLPSFQLRCVHGRYAVINIGGLGYRVIDVDQPQSTLRIARLDTWDDICRPRRANTTFPNNSSFTPLYSTSQNISIFYGCPLDLRLPAENNFSCPANGSRCTNFFGDQGFVTANPSNLSRCGLRVDVVVQSGALQTLYVGRASLNETLREGFDARYVAPTAQDCPACRASGGVCGSDPAWSQLACHCRNGTLPRVCLPATSGKKRDWVLKTIIGVVAAVVGMGLACLAVFIYQRRRKNRFVLQSSLLPRSLSSSGPSPKTAGSEKGGIHAGVHIFTYDELEEATNNFDSTKELGDGGFGAVYHGKLRDGRCVAVKRLYENNYRRLEQFMNEVEILTRLRHKNLVSLYGSTSGQSRELLLVYEFVANGTVASHLHGDRATAGALSWTVRMSIAAETASALTYLHFSEIVHRDVKTDNILLDENFCVKVADFGLSRLFPTQVTHVSTAPQGTPGYVDPEYHQCYQLTSKSDVYSFGVVLVELLSSKPAVDITRHRQEINLANMAMTKIQNNSLHELVDPSLGFETDGKVRRMVEAVAELAFQCLQSEKEMRPSMEEVLETLRRTQKEGFGVEDGESPADDTAPLRRKPPPIPPSPDSVTATWVSTSTTPNASG